MILQAFASNPVQLDVFGVAGALVCNIVDGLVRKLQVVLNTDVILDSNKNHRKGEKKSSSEETPTGTKHVHVGKLQGVHAPYDGSTGRLDTLVEASIVGKLAAIVGERTHEPVDACLPSGVVEAVEDVEEHRSNVSVVSPVLGDKAGSASGSTSVAGLEGIAATPNAHSDGKENAPGSLGTNGPAELADVQAVPENEGTGDLCSPVQDVVQGLGAGVKVRTVNSVELIGVEPVG